jgi:hypothetical protein
VTDVTTWGWDPVHSRWEKIPISATNVRKTATGQVYLGGALLHWIIINPSAPNALLEITDASAGGGAVILDFFLANRNTLCFTMAPPEDFTTGVWLETFTNLTSVCFGYTPH